MATRLAAVMSLLVFAVILGACSGAKSDKNKKVTAGFKVGRIPIGMFEYPEIHGIFTPEEAKNVCETDPQCSGFTYRGVKHSEQRFLTYFFRVVPKDVFKKLGKSNWHWTSYRVERPFTLLSGSFNGASVVKEHAKDQDLKDLKDLISDQSKSRQWSFLTNLVQMNVLTEDSKDIRFLTRVDLAQKKPSDQDLIIINNDKISEAEILDSTLSSVDVDCCARSSVKTSDEIRDLVDALSLDEVISVPCDIGKKKFDHFYVSAAQPVVLKECAAVCTAINWTMADVVNVFSYGSWTAQFPSEELITGVTRVAKIASSIQKDPGEVEGIRGHVQGEDSADLLKFVADSEESSFGPEVLDLIKELKLDQDKKGIAWARKGIVGSMSSSAKSMGFDAKITLLSGQLFVLVVPSDAAGLIECSPPCPKISSSWISHVLPQIANVTFLGNRVQISNVSPGDTLYIPAVDWSFVYFTLDQDATFVFERLMPSRGLEEAATQLSPVQSTTLNKALRNHQERIVELRRFQGILSQIKTMSDKMRKKKKKL